MAKYVNEVLVKYVSVANYDETDMLKMEEEIDVVSFEGYATSFWEQG